jgi:vancomycin permeability regulator SanA
VTRLVAVLGYSDGSTTRLHPICSARLDRAADVSRPNDVVLLSGWSRAGRQTSEAELMAAGWTGAARRVVLDRRARSTLGNAIGIARAARALDAREVVVVTSSWHGRRARTLVRAALAGTRARVVLAAASERPRRPARVREVACWSLVPLLALVAARAR